MADARRVAQRYKLSRSLLKDLGDLRRLSAALTETEQAFTTQFKVAAMKSSVVRVAEIENQTKALVRARNGRLSAQVIEATLGKAPRCKATREAAQEVQGLILGFEAHAAVAAKILHSLEAAA